MIRRTTAALAAALILPALPAPAQQATVPVDPAALEGLPLYDTGTIRVLATDAAGRPLVALATIPEGAVLPPHATDDGRARFATVLSGTMAYADGDTVSPEAETAYGPGATLLIPSGVMHWVAAREGAVRFLISVVPGDAPVPALRGG